MTRYIAVHTPNDTSETHISAPTRLRELAERHGSETSSPRWISVLAPDLNDERMFSIWEAPNADAVRAVIAAFGFLDHLDVKVFAYREWGPDDVLAAPSEGE